MRREDLARPPLEVFYIVVRDAEDLGQDMGGYGVGELRDGVDRAPSAEVLQGISHRFLCRKRDHRQQRGAECALEPCAEPSMVGRIDEQKPALQRVDITFTFARRWSGAPRVNWPTRCAEKSSSWRIRETSP